jgi:hypothetical protein
VYTYNSGIHNGRHKLTEAEVSAILAERAAGDTYTVIGERHGVGRSNVCRICTGSRWVHLRKPLAPVSTPVCSLAPFHHVQPVPARIWTVVHNLGYEPQVLVIDADRCLVYPGPIEHVDVNTVVVRFSAPVSGEVQCR